MSFDGLDFKNTDMLRWGVGSGAGAGGKLTSLQVDDNFWALRVRIKDLEDNPPEAVSIETISVIGSQMQINMTDGSTQGPFDLPIAVFRAVGEWVNLMALLELDIVTVTGSGLYMVLIDHTTPAFPAVFDPAAVDEDSGSPTFGQPLYQLVFPSSGGGGGGGSSNEDVPFFIEGFPGIGGTVGDTLQGFIVTHPMRIPVDFAGTKARLGNASDSGDGDVEYQIKINAVPVASLVFVEDNVLPQPITMATAIDLEAGDMITLAYPISGVSASAKNLFLTIVLEPIP